MSQFTLLSYHQRPPVLSTRGHHEGVALPSQGGRFRRLRLFCRVHRRRSLTLVLLFVVCTFLLLRLPHSDKMSGAQLLDKSAKDPLTEDEVSFTSDRLSHPDLQDSVTSLGNSNAECAKLPLPEDLHFSNQYWQQLKAGNGTFFLYSAFYDNRTGQDPVYIRVLGMINNLNHNHGIYCQLWFDQMTSLVISQVSDLRRIWPTEPRMSTNSSLQPYLMTCQVPLKYSQLVPASVSLVEHSCQKANNNLRIVNNQPPAGKKADLAVCVAGLSLLNNDLSVHLVEWLELLFLLGANKVFFYDLALHPNITKVINYYRNQSRVDVTKLTLPGQQPTHPSQVSSKRLNELIPYNDCLYKNMNLYKFLVLLDINEVIMPKPSMTWTSLMEGVAPDVMAGRKNFFKAAYCVRKFYFLDSMQEGHDMLPDVPHYMHMLQQRYRAREPTQSDLKCFQDAAQVVAVHNHAPISCLYNTCPRLYFHVSQASLHHYQEQCTAEHTNNCSALMETVVLDESILRFQQPLLRNTQKTLQHLGLV